MVDVPAELKKQLTEAMAKQDWAAVAKISREIAKSQADAEKTEREAREQALAKTTVIVKKAMDGTVQKLIDGDVVTDETVDGVFYTWDFGERLTTCRLVKTAKRAGGGGGAGKRYAINTTELLEKHGSEEFKDGVTFNQAWEAATDGNSKYKVRKGLLHKAGLM